MDADARCMRLAASQHGLITMSQALAYLSHDAIGRRVRAGVWRRVLPRVYSIGHAKETIDQRLMAAALWVRSDQTTRDLSCVSHISAASLLGLGTSPEPVHVTSPRRLRHPAAWVIVHRAELKRTEVTSVGRIPTTTPTRTLMDLGAILDRESVESALETALRKGTVSLERLERFVADNARHGKRGAASLRALLSERGAGYTPSESELELRFVRLVRAARLPLPVKQKVIVDQGRFVARVDFAYPDHDLVIEVHGWEHHGGLTRWRKDLWRGNNVTLAGARTLVFTWSDVTRRPHEVRDVLREAFRRFPGTQSSFAL